MVQGVEHWLSALSLDSLFEVVVDGKIHHIAGKALQQWILKEELKGPGGILFQGALQLRTFDANPDQ
jgi:hypothetical protein